MTIKKKAKNGLKKEQNSIYLHLRVSPSLRKLCNDYGRLHGISMSEMLRQGLEMQVDADKIAIKLIGLLARTLSIAMPREPRKVDQVRKQDQGTTTATSTTTSEEKHIA